LGAEIFDARVLDGADVAVTGLIAENVEPAEASDCFVDDANRSLRIGYVELNGPNAITEALDEIVELPGLRAVATRE
jgi:hypothetical protein